MIAEAASGQSDRLILRLGSENLNQPLAMPEHWQRLAKGGRHQIADRYIFDKPRTLWRHNRGARSKTQAPIECSMPCCAT